MNITNKNIQEVLKRRVIYLLTGSYLDRFEYSEYLGSWERKFMTVSGWVLCDKVSDDELAEMIRVSDVVLQEVAA